MLSPVATGILGAMDGSSYRTSNDPTLPRRLALDALPRATLARLRVACTHGEALLHERPRWVGTPPRWMLLSAVIGLLATPLFRTFGSIEQGPFADTKLAQAWLVCTAMGVVFSLRMALRAWTLHHPDRPPCGTYLFAHDMIEVEREHLTVWPLSGLDRVAQYGSSLILSFGPHGTRCLHSSDPVLHLSLPLFTRRLARALADNDMTMVQSLDPLHEARPLLEQAAPAPSSSAHSDVLRSWRMAMVLASLLGVVLTWSLRAVSDACGIASAYRDQRTTSLQLYLERSGLLRDRADRRWRQLAGSQGTDEALIAYFQHPATRYKDEADDELAERMLETRDLYRTSRYTKVGLRHRDEVEQYRLELVAQSMLAHPCHQDDGSFEGDAFIHFMRYVYRDDRWGQQMREVHGWRVMRQEARCARSMDMLLIAREELSWSPETQGAWENAWHDHFAWQRSESDKIARQTLPRELAPLLADLLAYLDAHPEVQHLRRPNPSKYPDEMLSYPPLGTKRPIVEFTSDTPTPYSSKPWHPLTHHVESALQIGFRLYVEPEGPRLVLHKPLQPEGQDHLQATLYLPGQPPRQVEVPKPSHRPHI